MILVICYNEGPGLVEFANSLAGENANSHLLTATNYLEAVKTDNTYHTDYRSFQIEKLIDIAGSIDKIYWWQPSTIDHWPDWGCQHILSTLKKIHNSYCNVIGLPTNDPLGSNIDTMFSDDSHAMFYGCSHTVGGPWIDTTNTYTYRVATAFNKIVSIPSCKFDNQKFHYVRGNFRNFSLFHKTQFKKNQIVIFQLTDFSRIRYYDDEVRAIVEQKQSDMSKQLMLGLSDRLLLHSTLDRIQSLINHAASNQTRFVFFNLGQHADYYLIDYYLQDFKEYIPDMLSYGVDFARDGLHFGVESNINFSTQIIKKINNLYR